MYLYQKQRHIIALVDLAASKRLSGESIENSATRCENAANGATRWNVARRRAALRAIAGAQLHL
jgi:hypothetical protein